jgi:hypothetical protein
LLRDKSFDYLMGAEFIPKEIKAELRQEAVAQGIIHGGAGDYNTQPLPYSYHSKEHISIV